MREIHGHLPRQGDTRATARWQSHAVPLDVEDAWDRLLK
jgi:hypothetical protein